MGSMRALDVVLFLPRMSTIRDLRTTPSVGTHTLGDMTKLDAKQVTRTLTIELPESEWAALRSVEPDAIGWLQGRIRERLQASGEAPPVSQFENAVRTSSDTFWDADEY